MAVRFSSLSVPALIAVAQELAAKRAVRAAESWHMYQVASITDLSHGDGFLVTTPSVYRRASGKFEQERYTLLANRCDCPDQVRLDDLNFALLRHAERGAVECRSEIVVCKHWGIVALHLARAREIAEAEDAARKRRSAAIAARASTWATCEITHAIYSDDTEAWLLISHAPGESPYDPSVFTTEDSAEFAAESQQLEIIKRSVIDLR